MEPTKETEKMAEHNNNNTPATTERKEERKEIKYQRLDLKDMFPGKRDSFAIVVDNLFSEQECKELIERSERQGYDEAKVGKDQVRVSEQRNNWRCIFYNFIILFILHLFNTKSFSVFDIKTHILDKFLKN